MSEAPAASQDAVIDFLSQPASHGTPAGSVERIDTHAAIVFLAGDTVFKLKRAVRLAYLDYSTLERRRLACRAELDLNRAVAPRIYREVRAVCRRPGGEIAFGEEGEILDWVVVMWRFDEAGLFDRLAERGALTRPLMLALTDEIARFHDGAPIRQDKGGRDGIAAVVDINARGMAAAPAGSFDAAAVRQLDAATRGALEAQAALLEGRRRTGHVRYCHGDLHLRNICLVDGRPTLFDRIEFSETLACTDVLYDLAFLLMDLDHRGLAPLANAVFNRYLDLRAEEDAMPALPLFLSLRAGVRAHVSAVAAAQQADADQADAVRRDGRAYLARALTLLQPAQPCLVAIGGLSGTGKTTLAYALAPDLGETPGARVLRSDVLRKRLSGVAPETRLARPAYTEAATAAVYVAQLAQARAALACGRAVVADAVFARPQQRAAIADVARELGVPFAGLWLQAPAPKLEQRVAARTADASDADVTVVRQQVEYDVGHVDWPIVDAGDDPACVLRRATAALEATVPPRASRQSPHSSPEPR